MTKEIDLLSTKVSTDTKVNTNNKEAKQGSSLFDSLLKDAKSTSSTKDESNIDTNLEKTTKKTSSKSKTTNDESESKLKAKESSSNDDSSESFKVTQKEEKKDKDTSERREQYVSDKKENKVTAKTTNNSLLERLVLEAKNVVKDESKLQSESSVKEPQDNNTKVLKKQNTSVPIVKTNVDTLSNLSENKNLKNTSVENNQELKINSNEKIDTKKSTKKNEVNLLDKTLTKNTFLEAKEKIPKEGKTDLNNKSLNIDTQASKIKDTKEDSFVSKIIVEKTIGSSSEVKENNISNLKVDLVNQDSKKEKDIKQANISDVKDTKDNLKSSLDLPEIKAVEDEIPNTLKSKDDTKSVNSKVLDAKTTETKTSLTQSSINTKTIISDKKKESSKQEVLPDNKTTSNLNPEDISKKSLLDAKTIVNDKSLSTNKQEINSNKSFENIKIDTKSVLSNTENIKNETLNKSEYTSDEPDLKTATNLSNKKVADEIDKIKSNDVFINESELSTLSKEELINAPKSKEANSFIDKLVEQSKKTIEEKKDIKNDKVDKTLIDDNKTNSIEKTNIQSKDFLTNIYLSAQKNSISNQSMISKTEAINLVKEAKSVSDIEKSAKILDLDPSKSKVSVEKNNTKEIKETIDKKSFIDRMAFNKNIRHEEFSGNLNKTNQVQSQVQSQAQSQTQTTVTAAQANFFDNTQQVIENDITLNVNTTLAQSIQSRIIGAQQQMSTMMSDVARQMYENYKPPITAFRISLNPTALGTISILMKNDKDNGISISLNISNNSTLDSFVENQDSLKSSLSKSFNDDTEFNLDFNSGENAFGSNSEQNNKNNFSEDEEDSQSASQLKGEDNIDKDEELDYM
jgi:hypothetical protein